eukprot:2868038-Prymnesium_polylepis.1
MNTGSREPRDRPHAGPPAAPPGRARGPGAGGAATRVSRLAPSWRARSCAWWLVPSASHPHTAHGPARGRGRPMTRPSLGVAHPIVY